MSGYTRTMLAPQAGRDSTIPRFHMEPVEDPIASAAAGRPIYREEARVQFIQPGSPNSPVERLSQEHIDRWPEEYARFQKGQEFAAEGTPIEQWPFLKRNHVMELKSLGIHTVEQCAGLSDIAVQRIGMGGASIRTNAKAYLDDADAMKIVSESLANAERAESKVANLTAQVEQLRGLVERLTAENVSVRDAPLAAETYIPGVNDPIERGVQAIPQAAPGASSLDSLPVRRGPGRPPRSEATA